MAVTITDCVAIAEAVRHAGVMLAVCHVLRYTPYQQKIQEVLASVRLCMHAQCQPVCVSPLPRDQFRLLMYACDWLCPVRCPNASCC
jgi:hypothetical protein